MNLSLSFFRATLLASACAFVVVACGGKEPMSLGENLTTKSCESAGGACKGLTAGACAKWGDANTYACGDGGVGVGCCLDGALDSGSDGAADGAVADSGDACAAKGGQCVAVIPGACAAGTVDPSVSCGGVGASCCIPSSSPDAGPTQCVQEGGQCVGLTPQACPGGHTEAGKCGTGVGVTCCKP